MKRGQKNRLLTILVLMISMIVPVVNVYAASELPQIPISVTLEGTLPEDAEDFTIKLKAETESAPMPPESENGLYSMILSGESSEYLPQILFEKMGVYEYSIWQESGNNTKCSYDPNVYHMTVYVTNSENYDGYDITVALYKDSESEKQAEIVFHNIYETEVPKTGDSAKTQIWIILATISLACVGYTTKRRFAK